MNAIVSISAKICRGVAAQKQDGGRTLSRRVVEIAWAIARLGWRRRRYAPWLIDEIKKLGHVHLCSVTLGKAGKMEARLERIKFQN